MDAPIELVVAIIIMVTSMGLAFFVINSSNTNQCLSTLKTQTQQLQEAILDVGLGSAGSKKTVQFSMPHCGDSTVSGIEFVKYTSPELCRRCPGHYAGCWQIVPVAQTSSGITAVTDAVTCIELPAERVSIEQAQTPDQSCTLLSNTPCPDGGNSCVSQLGIPASLYNPAGGAGPSNWVTLGSTNARQYLITFNKVLSVGDVTGHTQITMCAVPLGGTRNN